MVEGGAEKAWIFFRGFEIELYFRNTQKRTGREDFSGTPGTPYLCAVF